MSITHEDLQDFTRFADEKLQNGGAASMAELAVAWEESRELAQSIERLQQSDADIVAGRVKPLDEAFENVRQRLSEMR